MSMKRDLRDYIIKIKDGEAVKIEKYIWGVKSCKSGNL